MPVYLCKPGSHSPEPWRHGLPVYALPFPYDSTSAASDDLHGGNNNNNNNTKKNVSDSQTQMHQYEDDNTRYTTHNFAGGGSRFTSTSTSTSTSAHHLDMTQCHPVGGSPIRRVKHAEIVLVDQVSVHYGNYWLRLIWPGKRGGVAGYIALGGVNVVPVEKMEEMKEKLRNSGEDNLVQLSVDLREDINNMDINMAMDMDIGMDMGMDMDMDMDMHGSDRGESSVNAGDITVAAAQNHHEPSIPEEEGEDVDDTDDADVGLSDPPNNDFNLEMPKCESTGLYYPSTEAMALLALYDDGLSHSAYDRIDDLDGGENGKKETVFCRICRENLHDIDYDFEIEGSKSKTNSNVNANASANAATTTNAETAIRQRGMNIHTGNANQAAAPTRTEEEQANMPFMMQNHLMNESLNHSTQNEEGISPESTTLPNDNPQKNTDQPQSPIKAEMINHPYAENPLLAPCECSGSMAFVHYLCIEQWRCRSRHPAAKNGLNCETCNTAYTLPPPPARPDTEEEDWLDQMPPHVLAALRHPHPAWQIGAAIVRRRWLRPIAPILTSPIVALYCRARRTLKKRGVSRRRWACSLCRRRARWKCVRCLRSYYCSRQCQNVSWHIVHKHVCYKPARFWWSVVVYGLAYVYFVPGVLRQPLIYDLGLGFLWLSFVLVGVIGGGIATIMKREMGIDIRGRTLEVAVVCLTVWMGFVCWGLVWAFFGEPDQCMGVMDKTYTWQTRLNIPSLSMSIFQSSEESFSLSREQQLVKNLVLKPAKAIMSSLDKGLLMTGSRMTGWICAVDDSTDDSTRGCLQLFQKANADFMLPEHNGEKCASDFHIISAFCYFAGFIHILSTVWKRRERVRRGGRHHHNHQRPHQD